MATRTKENEPMIEEYAARIREAEDRRQRAIEVRRENLAEVRRLISEARNAGASMVELAEATGIERTNLYRLLRSGPEPQR